MKTNILRFNLNYFLLFMLVLLVETFIALFVRDRFVRPYLGDFLVVILLFLFIKIFINSSNNWILLAVLIIAFAVEALQYFSFVTWLGLGHSSVAGIVLGSTFSWEDLVAYALGVLAIWVVFKVKKT